MRKTVNHFLRAVSLAGFAMASLSAAGGVMAAETVLPSLSYDQAGNRLLKVEDNGLSQSENGGKTWQEIALPAVAEKGTLMTAAATAEDGNVLYIAGPVIGVQRSEDNGESWQALNDGLPSQNAIALAVHRNQPETLYTVIADDGLYQSDDAGKTWKKMDSGPTQTIRRLVHSDMEGSMQTGWLYAVSDDAVRLSMDCFCGWRLSGDLDAGKVYDVTYDVNAPQQVFVSAEQGLFRSDNGGQQWQPVASEGEDKVALALTPEGTLYALDAEGELMRSEDQGETWTESDE
ncbi:WD40/YVTN/BNR-like repeat-containing protein [Modicisalibacter luteus]|uniref:WD40/YVTN/BNR-like repeat-containing protein n=1 Tax=Modicisalibacter luteus TaxID=453962 RepID=A0ABV7LZ92_9GAMM|nr:YCF48-related protein [Halomonas lutea]GHA96307.1 glycosyl hydrolase [Halomonas lutea]